MIEGLLNIGRVENEPQKVKNLWIIDWRSTIWPPNAEKEIASSITFGDPLLRFSAGCSYFFEIQFDTAWKRGNGSSTLNALRYERGLGGSAVSTLLNTQDTNLGATCTRPTITGSFKDVGSVTSSVSSQRLRVKVIGLSGVGALNCEQITTMRIKIALVTGTLVEQDISQLYNGGTFELFKVF